MGGGVNTYVIMGLSQIVMLLLIELFQWIHVQGVFGSVFRMIVLYCVLTSSIYLLNNYFPKMVGKAKTTY